jgi:hypothetical protein
MAQHNQEWIRIDTIIKILEHEERYRSWSTIILKNGENYEVPSSGLVEYFEEICGRNVQYFEILPFVCFECKKEFTLHSHYRMHEDKCNERK